MNSNPAAGGAAAVDLIITFKLTEIERQDLY